MQRVFDPLAGAPRLANGAIFYELLDKELTIPSDEKLKEELEAMKAANSSALDISEEEADQLRIAMLEDLAA